MTGVSRRNALALGAVGSLVGFASPLSALSATGEDFEAKDLHKAYALLRHKGAGTTVMWLSSCMLYIRRGNAPLEPVCRYLAMAWNKSFYADETGTKDQIGEVGYFRDFSTGDIIDDWTNPATGRNAPVNHIKLIGSPTVIRPNGDFVAPVWAKEYIGSIGPAHAIGDQTHFNEYYSAALRTGGIHAEIADPRIHSITTFMADKQCFERAMAGPAAFVETNYSAYIETPVQEWMMVEEKETATLIWHCDGTKLRSADGIPDYAWQRCEIDHPGFLKAAPF